ncbi:MAG: hypothetical protein ACK4JY_03725 [Brevundimonas sp.]|uniref:hypothetical protein n=1 Tax=Brevundimonas sp. TaxID=1871086 RepID=UPI00391CEB4F
MSDQADEIVQLTIAAEDIFTDAEWKTLWAHNAQTIADECAVQGAEAKALVDAWCAVVGRERNFTPSAAQQADLDRIEAQMALLEESQAKVAD